MLEGSLLTVVMLTPLVGALLLLLLPPGRAALIRGLSLATAVLTFLVSLLLLAGFEAGSAGMQFVENRSWLDVAGFSVHYHLGVDGISLFLVLLTTFLMPLALLGSWSITQKLRSYMFFMLVLETGMIGVFVALDLVLFYVFWEIMLVPMYFLIGIWGGKRRVYAAVKFFLYTMASSLLMLAGILCLYFLAGHTFDLVEVSHRLATQEIVLSPVAELVLFLAFFAAFAVKVPLFPFHTWLPDAHVEAPTAGSTILAGVLLKMGTYGLLRFCLPLFPKASLMMAPAISVLAIVGILYGALVAMVQPDVKKLVAYSSVSHLGFVVLGIFAFNVTSIEGATYQMLNHGLSTGALFLLVGMIYDRRHTRLISEFGGLAHSMPVYAAIFLFITLSSIGLPGLNGFVGEFLILQGTFLESTPRAVAAALGVILSAVYMLWMFQRVFLGRLQRDENAKLKDLGPRELAILLPVLIMVVWMGVHSGTFLRRMDRSVEKVVERVEQHRPAQRFRVENRR